MKNPFNPGRILFDAHSENGRIIAVNKPTQIAAHGPCATSLLGVAEAVSCVIGEKVHPAHRLDRDTSGVMLLGRKTPLRRLHRAFSERMVDKTYWALVHGQFPSDCEVRMHCLLSTDHQPVQVGFGKESITNFRALRSFGERWTLVQATPETGRTHQIRASLAHLGFPIVGDELYYPQAGDCFRSDETLKPLRPYLHAKRLEVRGPFALEVEAPLEPDFQECLDQLAS